MKNIIFTLLFILLANPAFAAARFWVGGTGTWDATTTTNWAATSGGTGGQSVPGTSDTVTFDANSLTSAQTCTVNTNFSITSLSIGTMLGTLNFNTNNNSPTMATFDGVGAGATGAFNAGSGTWTVSGANQQVWGLQGSHLSLTLNNATINFTGAGAILNGGAKTYGTVNFSGGGAMQTIRADTFGTLTVTSNGVIGSNFIINTSVTVTGTFTATGSNIATSRILIQAGSLQFPVPLSAGAASLTNVDFESIQLGGAATWSGTSIGNAGNNTGTITYTTPVTRFWVGNGGNWNSTTHWASSSGGSSGATVPLCHDPVIFDANSFSLNSQTVTAGVYYLGKDIDFSGTTAHPPTWDTSVNAVAIQGSLTLATGMSMTGANTTITLSPWSPINITTAGVTLTNSWVINGGSTAVNLQDNFSGLVNRPFGIFSGELTTNNFNMTIGSLTANSSNSNAKILHLGTSTITASSNSAIYFGFQGGNVTFDAANATLICANGDSTNNKQINLGGQTYGTVIFQGSGLGSDLVVGNGTINNLQLNQTGMTAGAHTTNFTAGISVALTSLSVTSSPGNIQTLKSTSNGSPWTLSKSSGSVNIDFVSLQDSTATGGAKFYAGVNSKNVSGNTGWIFLGNDFLKGSNLLRGNTLLQ